MPVLRKRVYLPHQDRIGQNGLYIHSNPPRVLQLSSAHIKQLIRKGDIEKLEQVVLSGQGKRLMGEYSADYKIRTFLKTVPALLSKIALLHDAVNSGRLEELQSLLDEEPDKKKRLVMAKDEAGTGLLHKAVYYDLTDIAKYLIDNYPQIVSITDAEGRTPYHYSAMCRDPIAIQNLLKSAGADPTILDNRQRSAKYYMKNPSELELPSIIRSSSEPKKTVPVKDSLVIKKSNIRIWIHRRNIENLQRVVWEGHGSKLLIEHSNNPKIKKFLEAVPRLMRLIQDIHNDVINNELDSLKEHTETPIPDVVFSGKDSNGLTSLHKAAGLGRQEIAEYIVQRYPQSVNLIDNEGRTPLHFAAILKDDDRMYDYLIVSGTDESTLDNKQRTAAYYKTKSADIDTKLLQVVPDAPRMAHDAFPSNWDWSLITAATPTEETKKNDVFGQQPVKQNSNEEILTNEESIKEDDKQDDSLAEEPNDNHIETNGNRAASAKSTTSNKNMDENEENNVQGNEEPEQPPAEANEIPEAEPDDDKPETAPEPESNQQEEEEEENEVPEEPTRPSTTVKEAPESRPVSTRSVKNDNNNDIAADEEEGIIEGVVNGENEIESLNEEGQGIADDSASEDVDIISLIESGNMEQLAALVLNGYGDRLVGQGSDNPELQAFLDNVPVYMTKIKKIHLAAREGSLKELQAALDRRKFAIAKDSLSPNGATPLHIATIFGNTSVVRYLAGRFPETLQTIDENGRSPLHYAAIINDNGHYYNLLMHLGANNNEEDKFGHTPEYYKTNQDEFNHKSLLEEFGVTEELIQEMIEDKAPDDIWSGKKPIDDEDMSSVLERCYNVLHGRRNSSTVSASSALTTLTNNPSTTSILYKHMRKYIFDTVKDRITKLDHNLYDIIWPSVKKLPQENSLRVALEQDFPAGIIAPDYYIYNVFNEFLEPIIKEVNCIDAHIELQAQPETKFVHISEDDDVIDIDLDLDPHGKNIISATLDCTRNLEDFELPKYLNVGQLEETERLITTVLLSKTTGAALYPNATLDDIQEKGSGTYYTMNEVLEEPSEARIILASNGLLIPLWNIPDSERLHGKHWPYGRGVFISNSANLAVFVNVLDHIRIVTCTSNHKPGNIGQIYSRIYRLVTALNDCLAFKRDPKYGYLTARPTCLGNTLQFNLTVQFPYLIKEPDNLRHLCLVRALNYQKTTNTNDVVRIGNQQCLGLTELQTLEDFTTAVANILQLEKDLAMSNSMHIAAMFVNMFRRKKANSPSNNNNSQTNLPFFCTEEGRYLASSLGDPLIKGLTEVANKRPPDPIEYLATYLYNFANNNNNISRGSLKSRGRTQENQALITGPPINIDSNNAVPTTIDVVTLEPDVNNVEEDSAFSSTTRDEHGQSMLHFAAARSHGRNALYQLLLETDINIGYRDQLYRTARDISIQANIIDNTMEIDRYVIQIATKGDTDKLVELLLDGYDHIIDLIDEENVTILEAVTDNNQPETVAFLQSILAFEERRERVHHAIRQGDLNEIKSLLADENDTGSGKLLAIGKNSYGRCTIHVAVLCEQEEIVDYLAINFPDTLNVGDNLERTALHYAMGVEKIESISRVLIKAGAKRVLKDLKGRQPTYYFMNKSEILRLQEEEETF